MALSEKIDCSPNHLSYIENGSRGISLENFVRIANALEVSTDDLLMDSLDNTEKAMDRKFSSVMTGCSEREKRMLLALLFAVKAAIYENRDLF